MEVWHFEERVNLRGSKQESPLPFLAGYKLVETLFKRTETEFSKNGSYAPFRRLSNSYADLAKLSGADQLHHLYPQCPQYPAPKGAKGERGVSFTRQNRNAEI